MLHPWPFHIRTLDESWGHQTLREYHALQQGLEVDFGAETKGEVYPHQARAGGSVLGNPNQEGREPVDFLKRENKEGKQE